MEVFPTTLQLSFSIDTDEEYKTNITEMESGSEQATSCWSFPKRTVRLKCDTVDESVIKDLWKFYHARKGAAETFWFIYPELRGWYYEYVAQGDAVIKIFDLPSLNTTEASLKVYVDGVETAVTFTSGGGEGGSDRVTFASTPALGAIITADFEGKLRLRARFEADKLSYSLIRYLVYSYNGLGIKERKAT